VWGMLEAFGGIGSTTSAVLWHVVGFEETLKE
jgi:hypothetical protein